MTYVRELAAAEAWAFSAGTKTTRAPGSAVGTDLTSFSLPDADTLYSVPPAGSRVTTKTAVASVSSTCPTRSNVASASSATVTVKTMLGIVDTTRVGEPAPAWPRTPAAPPATSLARALPSFSLK